ncbi:MAG TPA: FAD-dependent oxidoreductase, partial [Pirellulales bacterium]|nr:FAD-dependent oxidoreductase [Pirellulales bacterium]
MFRVRLLATLALLVVVAHRARSADDADPAAFAARRAKLAAAVALSPLAETNAPTRRQPSSEPIYLAHPVAAEQVHGKHYDLVVIGATPGGIACAVRAARQGCATLLVQHNRHIGGMMSNGLMQWDALYGGPRAPLFSELLRNIERHYIATTGKDSTDHQTVRYTHEHYPIGWAEPHVAEREFNRLVAGEKNLALLLDYYPTEAKRQGRRITQLGLKPCGSGTELVVNATMFADGTYEGDLAAVAKVPYRVGREAREEFGEPHAGKLFTNIAKQSAPRDAVEARLNIRPYGSNQGPIDPTSPFTA